MTATTDVGPVPADPHAGGGTAATPRRSGAGRSWP